MNLNLINLPYLSPELLLSAVALLLILLAILPRRSKLELTSYVALAGLAASLALVPWTVSCGARSIFYDLLSVDKMAALFKGIFIVVAIFVIFFSQKSKELSDKDVPEYYAVMIGSVVGMCLLSGATNILMIYLALEFVSLTSYILVGFAPNSTRSSEAALKYVLFGAVASGIFLFGASLFYGITGSLNIASLTISSPATSSIYVVSAGLMLAGFLYKIAAVPMHAWCPDAYEGAPTPITAFLSVAPKAAGFAVLMRVALLWGGSANWPMLIAVVSAATMTFGNLAAIPQNNVKRMLAYSSIAHAGYMLMGIAAATQKGNEAILFYIIAYLLMNLGAFLVVVIVVNCRGSENMESFLGLGRQGEYGAVVAIAMTVFLLSLTGVPPFIGFVGKFYIFSAVIDAKLYWLAIVGIVNSVISLYYYMRIVRAMFLADSGSKNGGAFTVDAKRLIVLVVLLAAANLVLGLAWQKISEITANIF